MMPLKIQMMDQINVIYDEKHDILYIEIGQPEGAISEPLIDGIYVRRSVKDDRIVSIYIERYKERDKNMLLDVLPINIPKNKLPV